MSGQMALRHRVARRNDEVQTAAPAYPTPSDEPSKLHDELRPLLSRLGLFRLLLLLVQEFVRKEGRRLPSLRTWVTRSTADEAASHEVDPMTLTFADGRSERSFHLESFRRSFPFAMACQAAFFLLNGASLLTVQSESEAVFCLVLATVQPAVQGVVRAYAAAARAVPRAAPARPGGARTAPPRTSDRPTRRDGPAGTCTGGARISWRRASRTAV
jgi:hypothetical protein